MPTDQNTTDLPAAVAALTEDQSKALLAKITGSLRGVMPEGETLDLQALSDLLGDADKLKAALAGPAEPKAPVVDPTPAPEADAAESAQLAQSTAQIIALQSQVATLVAFQQDTEAAKAATAAESYVDQTIADRKLRMTPEQRTELIGLATKHGTDVLTAAFGAVVTPPTGGMVMGGGSAPAAPQRFSDQATAIATIRTEVKADAAFADASPMQIEREILTRLSATHPELVTL